MPSTKFSDEYTTIRETLKTASFAGVMEVPMNGIKGILAEAGPKVSDGTKLDTLRTITLKRQESERILEGAGLKAGDNAVPPAESVKKVAAAKFLRHLYMMSQSGAQTVWVHTSPKAYDKYISDEMEAAKHSVSALKSKLDKTAEVFDDTTKGHLAEAMRLGQSWCQKALTTLAAVKTDAKAKERLDRWFAPSDDKQDDLVKTLSAGFKKIVGTMNTNTIVLTDHPPYRKDPSKDLVEAFVKTVTETPKTIYIEKALYSNFDVSVLHDMKKNWARVLVHECTHVDAQTKDRGYGWKGIKPGVKITAANAAINADSWAFFAADCGGGLTAGDITRALDGTGGTVTKLPTNWN